MQLQPFVGQRIFVTLMLLGATQIFFSPSKVYASENSSGTIRSAHPTSIYIGLGVPAPSYVGVAIGWQALPELQGLLSYGRFWDADLSIYATEAAVRLTLLDTQLSPVMGGGINFLLFKGEGNIQTLSESALLFSIFLGLDWASRNGFRAAAGVNFHVPLRLNFPTLSLGWSF